MATLGSRKKLGFCICRNPNFFLATLFMLSLLETLANGQNSAAQDGQNLFYVQQQFPNFTDWQFSDDMDPCTTTRYVFCSQERVIQLSLSSLNLTGTLASQVGNITMLEQLLLDNNHIFGGIPKSIGNLTHLTRLNLSTNLFSGPIPLSFENLSNLTALDLSGNNLTGSIPSRLLKFCPGAFIGNPLLNTTECDNLNILSSPPPASLLSPPPTENNASNGNSTAIIGVIFAILGVSLMLVIALIWLCIRKFKSKRITLRDVEASEVEPLGEVAFPDRLCRFSLSEIIAATNRFSEEMKLGEGGSSVVYKAVLSENQTLAVKRLKRNSRMQGNDQFVREVDSISRTIHANLLPLVGFCLERGENILVFPFMPYGSIADHLRGGPLPGLPLSVRPQIARGVADGLHYMHSDCKPPLLHGDIKVDNVLLDFEYRPSICDFGLVKSLDENRCLEDGPQNTALRGTVGYIAPEYHMLGSVSEKTDVYAFGVFLVELVVGFRMIDHFEKLTESDCTVQEWVIGILQQGRVLDAIEAPRDVTTESFDKLENLLQTAVLCMQELPENRPTMKDCCSILRGDGLEERWSRWQNLQWFPITPGASSSSFADNGDPSNPSNSLSFTLSSTEEEGEGRGMGSFSNSPEEAKWSGSMGSVDGDGFSGGMRSAAISEIYPMDLSGPR